MDRTYGLSFPVVFEGTDPDYGLPAYPGLMDSIESSIRVIFSWLLNRRYFLPSFGSPLENMLQEPSDNTTTFALRFYLIEALKKWEKRIEVISLEVESTGETYHLVINARVLAVKTNIKYEITI